MLNLNVAVDTGYGCGLGKSSLKEVKINNYIKKIKIKNDALDLAKNITTLNEDSILMKYKDSYYAIGKLALKDYPNTTRNITSKRIKDEYHLIELLACIGLICPDHEYNINLMVGLPVKLQNEGDEFTQWLKQDFEFSFFTKDNVINKIVHIKNVDCILQPVSPIFTLNPIHIEKKIISIDIGHGTFDMVFMNEVSIVKETGARLDAEGMQYCYKYLEELLVDKYSNTVYENGIKELTEKQLETAIEEGTLTLSGDTLNIDDLLKDTLTDYVDYLYNIIEKKYRKFLSQADIVLINGGIFNNEYFTNIFEEKFFDNFNIRFTKHSKPQWAIVYGMFLYMNKYKGLFKNKDIYFNSMNIQNLYIE